MGAWGAESFANDTALDWLDDLVQAEDTQILGATLAGVADKAAYTELGTMMRMDRATEAIAAAEVIAALVGRPASDLPPIAVAWAIAHPAPNLDRLCALATSTLDHIQQDTELDDLWVEGYSELWRAIIRDLRFRLSPDGGPSHGGA
jgi:hypothetical protein